jgi:hypothetical protein
MRFTLDDFWRMRKLLENQKGFTWDFIYNDIIDDAWMIGGASHELVISRDRLKLWSGMDNIIEEINNLIDSHPSFEPHDNILFYSLGGWIDEKGDLIIEISQGVKDTMEAIRLGIKRHQKSIYHLKRGELISIDEIKALIGIYHDLREDKK